MFVKVKILNKQNLKFQKNNKMNFKISLDFKTNHKMKVNNLFIN